MDFRTIIFVVAALSVLGILALFAAVVYVWFSDRRSRRHEKRR